MYGILSQVPSSRKASWAPGLPGLHKPLQAMTALTSPESRRTVEAPRGFNMIQLKHPLQMREALKSTTCLGASGPNPAPKPCNLSATLTKDNSGDKEDPSLCTDILTGGAGGRPALRGIGLGFLSFGVSENPRP